MTSQLRLKYPAINVDSAYGTTVTIPLKRSQWVRRYVVTFVEGTLNGGTSPAWTISQSNPAFSNIQVQADNNTLYNLDTDVSQEMTKLTKAISPSGLVHYVDMEDFDYSKKGTPIEGTQFPSFRFSQNNLLVTIPALSSLTSGGPTSTTGSQILVTEIDVSRSANAPAIQVRKLQRVANLNVNGENDLVNTLIPAGFVYKALFFHDESNVSSQIKQVIDDRITIYDEYVAQLQSENTAEFGIAPDTGYFAKIFMRDASPSELLDLTANNTSTISVQTTGTGLLKVAYVLYAGVY